AASGRGSFAAPSSSFCLPWQLQLVADDHHVLDRSCGFVAARRSFRSSTSKATETDRLESILSQNFIHGFSPRQLINELIQVANFSHGRLLDFLHSDAANHTLDQGSGGV